MSIKSCGAILNPGPNRGWNRLYKFEALCSALNREAVDNGILDGFETYNRKQ